MTPTLARIIPTPPKPIQTAKRNRYVTFLHIAILIVSVVMIWHNEKQCQRIWELEARLQRSQDVLRRMLAFTPPPPQSAPSPTPILDAWAERDSTASAQAQLLNEQRQQTAILQEQASTLSAIRWQNSR